MIQWICTRSKHIRPLPVQRTVLPIVLLVSLLCLASIGPVHGDTPYPIEWQKCLGGSGQDYAREIQQTGDSGYVIAGHTNSDNGNVSGNHGTFDYWVVKLTNTSEIAWQKCLGGTWTEQGQSIYQTDDGGYILCGSSQSSDGNVSKNYGGTDYWIVKLTGSGDIEWERSYGGSGNEEAHSIQQTDDNGYIIAGTTISNNGNVTGNHGDYDAWVMKLASNGRLLWEKCLGGSANDGAYSIQQTAEGGYILSGLSRSSDGNVTENHGGADFWVVKLNDSGAISWEYSFGGSGNEEAFSVNQTIDGGYIVAGYTESSDGDVSGKHPMADAWVIKLTGSGTSEWKYCYGGSGVDKAYSVRQTDDGGYIVAGQAGSLNGDLTDAGKHDGFDYWVLKLSSAGVIEWQKCLGGNGNDIAHSIHQTIDGGYVLAGDSSSANSDGDVTGHHGATDYWVVKLTSPAATITVTSPNGGEKWKQGTSHAIRWTYTGDPGANVKIQLLKAGVVKKVISKSVPIGADGSGSFTWKVPFNQELGKDYKIRIISTSDTTKRDASDKVFAISAGATITVKVPNGGEIWKRGTIQTIKWTYTGNPGSKVKIELIKGTKVDSVVTAAASIGKGGSGSYKWKIPASHAAGTDYKIRVTSTTQPTKKDVSNKVFRIKA